MGTDARVVDSARVSFSKEASNYNDEQNDRLIKYLAKHNHFTPFTHPQITIRETVPIFVARQRFKHSVGFSYNEVSRRYVDDKPEFFVPEYWRKRPEGSVKQGSSEEKILDFGYIHKESSDQQMFITYEKFLKIAENLYETALAHGVAPEMARMMLPQSMYTSYYVTGSLAAWARAYKQRIDSHSQKEIQDLAKQWDTIIRPLFPVSWEALTHGQD